MRSQDRPSVSSVLRQLHALLARWATGFTEVRSNLCFQRDHEHVRGATLHRASDQVPVIAKLCSLIGLKVYTDQGL